MLCHTSTINCFSYISHKHHLFCSWYKQDGSHEPECIHVLGLRVQTSAIKKRTLFSTHRALIVAAKAPDDRRLDDSRANLHRDTEEQKMTEYQGFKFCMFAIDMFVPYLMQNSRCQSAPSTAKVHVATRLLLQLAAMIAVHHQPATRSDASFSATPAL